MTNEFRQVKHAVISSCCLDTMIERVGELLPDHDHTVSWLSGRVAFLSWRGESFDVRIMPFRSHAHLVMREAAGNELTSTVQYASRARA